MSICGLESKNFTSESIVLANFSSTVWFSLCRIVNKCMSQQLWTQYMHKNASCESSTVTRCHDRQWAEAKFPVFRPLFPHWQLLSVVLWESLASCWRLHLYYVNWSRCIGYRLHSLNKHTTYKTYWYAVCEQSLHCLRKGLRLKKKCDPPLLVILLFVFGEDQKLLILMI